MDTEKVHSIEHCGINTIGLVHPFNASKGGPDGGHKLLTTGQWGMEAIKIQRPAAAQKMPMHLVDKEASTLLCEAGQGRPEDGSNRDDSRFQFKYELINSGFTTNNCQC